MVKTYRPILVSLIGIVATFVYFSLKVSGRAYTQSDYENDRHISASLGLDCAKFKGTDLVGKSTGELDRLAALRNSVLIKGKSGEIQTTAENESTETIETRSYTVCGQKFVVVLSGDKIVETIYLAKHHKGRVFGIDG